MTLEELKKRISSNLGALIRDDGDLVTIKAKHFKALVGIALAAVKIDLVRDIRYDCSEEREQALDALELALEELKK